MKLAILLMTALLTVPNAIAASDSSRNWPMKVGDVTLVKGRVTHSSGIVLDDEGTAHLLTHLANGEYHLLRISRRGMVQELIMYRGWPYILDKRGRLFAFDISWSTSLRNKLPYITMRALKRLPVALGAGLGVYGVALIDQSFLGLIQFEHFREGSAFWSGFMAYYAIDVGNTVIFKSHRAIDRGGNFFTEPVATGVTEIREDAEFDDYVVVSRQGRTRTVTQYLSHIAPKYAGSGTCIEYLTKMGLR